MISETIAMFIIIWESANLYLNKAEAGKINTKEQTIHIHEKIRKLPERIENIHSYCTN